MSNNPNISISGSPPPPRQPEVDSETWITASEAASILHLSLRTVLNRAASGKLPSKIPDDIPFTYDGRQNYLIRLEGLPQLDEHEMRGMRREDAGNYLNMVAEKESLRFTYPAQQALIRIALSKNAGGIHAFTTIIGRCITLARVMYYKAPGRSFPDNTRCIRPAVPEGKTYPGAELILTPPATPEPVLIDEGMVSNMLNEYKSHFPTDTSESRKKS